MKIDPDLEAFFVLISLMHGTHPEPKFGIDRNNLMTEVAAFIANYPGKPDVLDKVARNYAEMGSKLTPDMMDWFYTKMAGSYLDWLYAQPVSMELLPQALDKQQQARVDALSKKLNRDYWEKF